MDSSQVQSIRTALGLSTLQLAERLGVPQGLVLDWESGTRFPTLKHVQALGRLQSGAARAPHSTAPHSTAPHSTALLSPAPPGTALQVASESRAHWLDPGWATLLRKLFAHPELYAAAARLAQTYPDPAHTEAAEAASDQRQ